MRLSTEVMYAATEMVVDNPQMDGDVINTEVAEMVVRYYDKFVEAEERYDRTNEKRKPRKTAVAVATKTARKKASPRTRSRKA